MPTCMLVPQTERFSPNIDLICRAKTKEQYKNHNSDIHCLQPQTLKRHEYHLHMTLLCIILSYKMMIKKNRFSSLKSLDPL